MCSECTNCIFFLKIINLPFKDVWSSRVVYQWALKNSIWLGVAWFRAMAWWAWSKKDVVDLWQTKTPKLSQPDYDSSNYAYIKVSYEVYVGFVKRLNKIYSK